MDFFPKLFEFVKTFTEGVQQLSESLDPLSTSFKKSFEKFSSDVSNLENVLNDFTVTVSNLQFDPTTIQLQCQTIYRFFENENEAEEKPIVNRNLKFLALLKNLGLADVSLIKIDLNLTIF